jgi:hypothetical protein
MRGFLHCYYKDIYGIRPVERELQNTVVWLSCGFDRPPSRGAVGFLPIFDPVVNKVFDHLVRQAARRGLLDLTYNIIRLMHGRCLLIKTRQCATIQRLRSTTTAARLSRPKKDPDRSRVY